MTEWVAKARQALHIPPKLCSEHLPTSDRFLSLSGTQGFRL
jgi:hypothetical protein